MDRLPDKARALRGLELPTKGKRKNDPLLVWRGVSGVVGLNDIWSKDKYGQNQWILLETPPIELNSKGTVAL